MLGNDREPPVGDSRSKLGIYRENLAFRRFRA